MTPITRALAMLALGAGAMGAQAARRPHPAATVPVLAHVVAFRGTVSIGDGLRPMIGLTIKEGDRVTTGEASSLSLKMPDGSTVTLPSQSVLVVERLRRRADGRGWDRVLRLDAGRAAVEVTPDHRPGNRFEIRTPVSVAAVRGTVFRIGLPDAGRSTTEVLRGEVGVTTGHAPLSLPAGYGTVATPAGPGGQVKLLPGPVIDGQAHPTAANGPIAFDLAPLPGASAYHLQLARDRAFLDLVNETSGATHLTLPAVADGTYYVRVTALDGQGLEGLPRIYPYQHHVTQTPPATPPQP